MFAIRNSPASLHKFFSGLVKSGEGEIAKGTGYVKCQSVLDDGALVKHCVGEKPGWEIPADAHKGDIMKIAARIGMGCVLLTGLLASTAPAVTLYTLKSPNEMYQSYFGYSVSWAGDVNNDGYHDVIVGAPGEDISGQQWVGRAYVIDGHTGSVIWTLTSPNPEWEGQFGSAVSWAGDPNNDGYDDVIVGAPYEDHPVTPEDAGRAYVFSGQTGGLLRTLISPSPLDFGYFGCSVSGADDVNDDGRHDVVVGALNDGAYQGRAYVFSGLDGSLIWTLASPSPGTNFGVSVSAATDVNNDDHADVVVGSPSESPGGVGSAGRAYVFSGQSGGVLTTLTSPDPQWYGSFGQSVSGVGQDMIIVGAPQESPGASPDSAGRAHLFNGATGVHLRTFVSPNEQWNGKFGSAVSWVGDADGGWMPDVIVGAPRESLDVTRPEAGRAYVLSSESGADLYWFTSRNAQAYGWFGSSLSGTADTDGDNIQDMVIGAYWEAPAPSPTSAGRAYIVSPYDLTIALSGTLDQGLLWLWWPNIHPAWEYWIFGTGNNYYFEPAPWNMVDEVNPATTYWSSPAGVGDPDLNMTYMVMAVNALGQELGVSNRYGEFDFGTGTPP